MFKDEDLHTTMWIPAPHAIEGYAPGIPTQGRCWVWRVFDAVVEAFFGCGGPRNAVATAVKRDVSVDAVTVAPRPTIPSLMIIVEDMSRNNRGWGEGLKMRNSVGGSKTLWGRVVVRAPPLCRGVRRSV